VSLGIIFISNDHETAFFAAYHHIIRLLYSWSAQDPVSTMSAATGRNLDGEATNGNGHAYPRKSNPQITQVLHESMPKGLASSGASR